MAITGSSFKAAVVVVAPGTTVTWRNDDRVAHTLAGDFASPGPIAPGATFARRFDRLGEFHYHDAANGAIKGTVVVAAAGSAPKKASTHGTVTRYYRGTMTLTVNESYEFYDGEWHSTKGPCNGEVGSGTRNVVIRLALPKVTYFRGFGIESLIEQRATATLARYHEALTAKAAMSSSGRATCPDGTTDEAPDVVLDCDADYSGRKST